MEFNINFQFNLSLSLVAQKIVLTCGFERGTKREKYVSIFSKSTIVESQYAVYNIKCARFTNVTTCNTDFNIFYKDPK